MTDTLHFRSTLKLSLTILAGGLLIAGAQGARADDAATVAPLISESTWLVVKVDTSRLELPELSDELASLLPGGAAVARETAEAARQSIQAVRAAADGQPIYATVGIPRSKRDMPVFFFLRQSPQAQLAMLMNRLGGLLELDAAEHAGMLVVMPEQRQEIAARLEQFVPSKRPEFGKAFAAVADYPIQVLLVPPGFVRRTVTELLPTLPEALGGGPSSVLTDGLLWAALGIDPAKAGVELIVQSASPQAAEQLRTQLPELAEAVYQAVPETRQRFSKEAFEAAKSLIESTVQEDRIVMRFSDDEVAGGLQLFAATVAAARERIQGRQNLDKFKQITLAMHNYYDTYKMFPPRDEVRGEDGRSGLSWRVHILPFVNEMQLYDQFHLDEPWDSPHNKTLIEKMPKVYYGGEIGLAAGHTTFQAPVGEDTVYGGEKATRFRDIADGTSNTIAVVQVKPELAVPWTAPQDYAFDPNDPARGLQIGPTGLFLAAMCDGSVRRGSPDIPKHMLLRLFHKNDGEPVNWLD